MKSHFGECKPNHQLQCLSGETLAGMAGTDEVANAGALQSPADDVEQIDTADNGAVFLPTNQKTGKIVAAATAKVIVKLLSTVEARERDQTAIDPGIRFHQFGKLPVIGSPWPTEGNPLPVKRHLPRFGGFVAH